jgi:hypothetical protein
MPEWGYDEKQRAEMSEAQTEQANEERFTDLHNKLVITGIFSLITAGALVADKIRSHFDDEPVKKAVLEVKRAFPDVSDEGALQIIGLSEKIKFAKEHQGPGAIEAAWDKELREIRFKFREKK